MQQEEKKLSLDEIHAELLEQLRDITAVCKKHNISYNTALVAGVPRPLRSTSSGISSLPAFSMADRRVSSD